jgi:hypothetical protein
MRVFLLICAALWLVGWSAYRSANIPARPAWLPAAVEAAPASGDVTLASLYGPGLVAGLPRAAKSTGAKTSLPRRGACRSARAHK